MPEVDRQFCQGNWESLSILLLCMENNKTFCLFFAWSWQWIILELFAMLTAPILPIHSFMIRVEICISTVCIDTDSQAFQRTPATQGKDLSVSNARWCQENGQKDYLYFISPLLRLKHCNITIDWHMIYTGNCNIFKTRKKSFLLGRRSLPRFTTVSNILSPIWSRPSRMSLH